MDVRSAVLVGCGWLAAAACGVDDATARATSVGDSTAGEDGSTGMASGGRDDPRDEDDGEGEDEEPEGDSSSGGAGSGGSDGNLDSTGDLPEGGLEIPEGCEPQECSWDCDNDTLSSLLRGTCELPPPCSVLWFDDDDPIDVRCHLDALRLGVPAALRVQAAYGRDPGYADWGIDDYFYVLGDGVVVLDRVDWNHQWDWEPSGVSEIFAPATLRAPEDPWWDTCSDTADRSCLAPENLFVETCRHDLATSCVEAD